MPVILPKKRRAAMLHKAILILCLAVISIAPAAGQSLSKAERQRLERAVARQKEQAQRDTRKARELDRAYRAARTLDAMGGHAAGAFVPGGSAAYKAGRRIGDRIVEKNRR